MKWNRTGLLRPLAAAAALIVFCTACASPWEEGQLFSEEDSSSSSQTVSPVPEETTAPADSDSSESSTESDESSSGTSEEKSTAKPTAKPTAEPTAAPTEKPLETVSVTIPEGFTVMQIAERLEANGVCSAADFVEVSQEYAPQSFTVPSDSNRAYKMEGYLYPDTYEFYVDDDPQDVLIKLLNNYRAKAGGISSTQLVVASIVEKESRSAENAVLVASVIYNRLEAGMKLEMDPTREYINNYVTGSPYLGSTGKFASLYNTYKCSGLPAGPICNPGSRAIQAAVNPADSDYLFFFFGNDNQNHYSKTFEEHQAAMEKYGVQYS